MKNFISVIALIAITAPAFAEENPGQHFMESWDLNEDGTVTVEEITERRTDVFASFDSDEDGFLTAEEYKTFDEARDGHHEGDESKGYGGGKGQGKNSPMTMKANDNDADGKVSKDEFIGNAAMMFTKMDKNGDGTVNSADFKKR